MKYCEEVLKMDNFREVLKDFSIDIQDVVRSAILDDIDITGYLRECMDDPYRLDQIRLCMKEGLGESVVAYRSGDEIYAIRSLNRKGVDVSPLLKYNSTNLSKQGFMKLKGLLEDGFGNACLEVDFSIIPNSLLEYFDYAIRHGVDMKKYNNGKQYGSKYLSYCIEIEEAGKPVERFLENTWDVKSLREMWKVACSRSVDFYNKLLNMVFDDDTPSIIRVDVMALTDGVEVGRLSDDKAGLILKAKDEGINLLPYVNMGYDELVEKYSSGVFDKSRVLSGTLYK